MKLNSWAYLAAFIYHSGIYTASIVHSVSLLLTKKIGLDVSGQGVFAATNEMVMGCSREDGSGGTI